MDILLYFLSAICLLLGLIGCFLPVLPGPPIAYLGLWALQATERVAFLYLRIGVVGLLGACRAIIGLSDSTVGNQI